MSRVGIVGLWHETNTYSARRIELADFEAFELVRGDELPARHEGTGTVIGGMLEIRELTFVPVYSAGAWPSGPVSADGLAELFEGMERELDLAPPLDGILFNLHGAMVADGHDDVELETLRRVRSLAGDVPVAAVLDLHGNPSPDMVALCDATVAYDTYPHVDMRERGREAAELMRDMLSGRRLRPTLAKIPLLSCPLGQATNSSPMRDLHALAREHAQAPGIARISLLPGFPYSDVARAGFTIVATAEPGAADAAERAVAALVDEVERRRADFEVRGDDPATAVARALVSPNRPLVLVDVADNVGGGSPGDGTEILRQLLEQRATEAVVVIADKEVARVAAAAGPSSVISAKIGGKTDDRHGSPIAVEGRVLRVTDGRYTTGGSWMTGQQFSMGVTAVVAVDGVTVVVTERAVPPFHAEQLTSVGIDPREVRIIVAKGAIAWRAAYGDIARDVIEVDSPGVCPLDPSTLERSTTPMSLESMTPARHGF